MERFNAYVNTVKGLDIETNDKLYLITEFAEVKQSDLIRYIAQFGCEDSDLEELAKEVTFNFILDGFIDYDLYCVSRFVSDSDFLDYVIEQLKGA